MKSTANRKTKWKSTDGRRTSDNRNRIESMSCNETTNGAHAKSHQAQSTGSNGNRTKRVPFVFANFIYLAMNIKTAEIMAHTHSIPVFASIGSHLLSVRADRMFRVQSERTACMEVETKRSARETRKKPTTNRNEQQWTHLRMESNEWMCVTARARLSLLRGKSLMMMTLSER